MLCDLFLDLVAEDYGAVFAVVKGVGDGFPAGDTVEFVVDVDDGVSDATDTCSLEIDVKPLLLLHLRQVLLHEILYLNRRKYRLVSILEERNKMIISIVVKDTLPFVENRKNQLLQTDDHLHQLCDFIFP